MMKKLLMAIAVMATTLSANAQQQKTDIDKIENGIYFKDVEDVKAGNTTIKVAMKNSIDVQTIGIYEIALPEGINLYRNSKGNASVKLITDRSWDEEEEVALHALSFSTPTQNSLRIGILQQTGAPFSGNDGDIFSFQITVPETTEAGEYLVKFAGQEFSNRTGKINPDDTYCAIYVGCTPNEVVVADKEEVKQIKKQFVNGVLEITMPDGRVFYGNGAQK